MKKDTGQRDVVNEDTGEILGWSSRKERDAAILATGAVAISRIGTTSRFLLDARFVKNACFVRLKASLS